MNTYMSNYVCVYISFSFFYIHMCIYSHADLWNVELVADLTISYVSCRQAASRSARQRSAGASRCQFHGPWFHGFGLIWRARHLDFNDFGLNFRGLGLGLSWFLVYFEWLRLCISIIVSWLSRAQVMDFKDFGMIFNASGFGFEDFVLIFKGLGLGF